MGLSASIPLCPRNVGSSLNFRRNAISQQTTFKARKRHHACHPSPRLKRPPIQTASVSDRTCNATLGTPIAYLQGRPSSRRSGRRPLRSAVPPAASFAARRPRRFQALPDDRPAHWRCQQTTTNSARVTIGVIRERRIGAQLRSLLR